MVRSFLRNGRKHSGTGSSRERHDHARRTESDAEAILEANGFACHPGPRARTDPVVLSIITAALRGPFLLSMPYSKDHETDARPRLIKPYGLLLGIRRYLVARVVGDSGRMRHFRLARITSINIEARSLFCVIRTQPGRPRGTRFRVLPVRCRIRRGRVALPAGCIGGSARICVPPPAVTHPRGRWITFGKVSGIRPP